MFVAVSVILGVMAVPVAAASPAPRANPPSHPVSRDLATYTLFAFNSLAFKGGQNASRGIISGGNVGANGEASPCANGRLTMDDGTQLTANNLRASDLCSVWDIFANSTSGAFTVVPRNSGPTAFTAPVLAAPALPSIVCDPGNPLTISKSQTATVEPGAYGDVVFQDGSMVTLRSGLYQFCDLNIGENVVVTTDVATQVRINKSYSQRNGTVWGQPATCAVPVVVGANGVKLGDAAVGFARNGTVYGRFFAPTGQINLGNTSDLFGAYWALDINSDFNVNVTQCPPQTGEFPIVKSIVGSGAGLQGPIEIQIVCTPPNGSIPPFTIPGGATGNISTVVTGITVPATCHVNEVKTGDNPNVDIDVTVLGGNAATPAAVAAARNLQVSGADVPVCPVAKPLKQTRRSRANENGAVVINDVQTTTSSTSSTSSTSTTSTTSTSTTQPTTTTTGGSSTTGGETTTTGGETTTTAESITTTTEPTTTTTQATTTTSGGTTTTGGSSTTTAGSTSTAGSTTVTTSATTTAATTTASPTTTAAGETTTTVSRETIPPDCTVPPTVSPTEVLPATGSSGVSPMVLLALLLGALGAVMLVVTTVRRPVDE